MKTGMNLRRGSRVAAAARRWLATLWLVCAAPLVLAQSATTPEDAVISAMNDQVAESYQKGHFSEALQLARRAAEAAEATYGPGHASTAIGLNNLAFLLQLMDRYDEALPLLRRALEIRLIQLGVDHPYTAISLNNLALLLQSMDRYDDALPLFQRALHIHEKTLGPDNTRTADSLNNLGGLFEAMARDDEALPLYRRAWQIYEKASESSQPEAATILDNLGNLYRKIGFFNEALPLLHQSLQMKEQMLGSAHPDTAKSHTSLARLFVVIGNFDDALSHSRLALSIYEKTFGVNHTSTAIALNNVAHSLMSLRRYGDALPLLRRALDINEKAHGPDHSDTATSLNNLALLLQNMERYIDAQKLHRRALQIREKTLGPHHPDTADSLNNIASVLSATDSHDDALPLFRRALRIVMLGDITDATRNNGAIERLSVFSANLAYLLEKYHDESELDEAIFYYKLSINTRQRMRAGTKGMDKTMRDSFTNMVAGVYQELAKLLIKRGRLAEAERVLLMLKESDLTDYLRRNGNSNESSGERLRWTAEEDKLHQDLQKIAKEWQAYGADWQALDDQLKRGQIKDDGPEFIALNTRRQKLETQTDNQLKAALRTFHGSLQEAAKKNQQSFESARTALAQKISEIQQLPGSPSPKTAGLVLLPGARGLTMIVTTDQGAVPLMVPVDEATLGKLALDLRTAIQKKRNHQPAAQALYRHLIAPAEAQLGNLAASIQQWAILPYGALRNLPFAALMNEAGQHLIERYALVTLTADGEGGFNGLDVSPKPQWRSAGFGASIADSAFNNVALPGVKTELCGIVSDPSTAAECKTSPQGVIAGRRYLDQQFTADTLNRLMGPPVGTQVASLLHIATHFSIERSLLLLGDGDTLTLAKINQWNPRLGHYDLVALSACDSGTSEAGVESLGGMFRKQGAKSVLATLWPVADVGAGPLMIEFYRRRGEQRVMAKSEALRRAQLAMLSGDLKNPDSPTTNLRHPYFWAGYVLMGNWL